MGLKWKLKDLMLERKISNKLLAESMGIHRNTVLLLKEEDPVMIRMKHLETLCEVLKCQPSDLFEFCSDLGLESGSECTVDFGREAAAVTGST